MEELVAFALLKAGASGAGVDPAANGFAPAGWDQPRQFAQYVRLFFIRRPIWNSLIFASTAGQKEQSERGRYQREGGSTAGDFRRGWRFIPGDWVPGGGRNPKEALDTK